MDEADSELEMSLVQDTRDRGVEEAKEHVSQLSHWANVTSRKNWSRVRSRMSHEMSHRLEQG